MNIFYIGSAGALSLLPFKNLLSAGLTVSVVGVFNPVRFDNKIITLENESLALAANASDIPLIDLSQPVAEIVDHCERHLIDVILMSCYRKRLPNALINLPPLGCYNMHPSLLPRFRGPEPIFWQMKYASVTGISWHRVDSEFDTGDIVCQQKVLLDDGATYSQICSQLAATGVKLMLQLLTDLRENSLSSSPQEPATASYQHYPVAEDFEIDVAGSARQAYNFMCATQAFSSPFLYHSGGRQFYLEAALDFDDNLSLECAEVQADRLYIPCNVGVLITSYTDKIPA